MKGSPVHDIQLVWQQPAAAHVWWSTPVMILMRHAWTATAPVSSARTHCCT